MNVQALYDLAFEHATLTTNYQELEASYAAVLAERDELRTALLKLCDAVSAERAAQDAYTRASSNVNDDVFDTAADAYQDACATTVICENEARVLLKTEARP